MWDGTPQPTACVAFCHFQIIVLFPSSSHWVCFLLCIFSATKESERAIQRDRRTKKQTAQSPKKWESAHGEWERERRSAWGRPLQVLLCLHLWCIIRGKSSSDVHSARWKIILTQRCPYGFHCTHLQYAHSCPHKTNKTCAVCECVKKRVIGGGMEAVTDDRLHADASVRVSPPLWSLVVMNWLNTALQKAKGGHAPLSIPFLFSIHPPLSLLL